MTIKNIIAVTAFAIIALSACTKRDNPNRKLIEDHFKYMNLHNVSAIKNQYADTAAIFSYVMPGLKTGPLGADEIYHFMFFQSPSEQYQVINEMDTDTTSVVQYVIRGYGSNFMMRNGYSYRNCTIFKIKAGKIVGESTYTTKQNTEGIH